MFVTSAPFSTSSQCTSATSPFDLTLPESQKMPSSQHYVHRSSHRGVIQPDMCLNPVSLKKEKKLYLESAGKDGRPRPERFAVLLFKSLVPQEVYREWSGAVNFDGSRGKNALPNNLRKAIAETVSRKFPNSTSHDWKMIRDRLNELLRKRRLTFPLFLKPLHYTSNMVGCCNNSEIHYFFHFLLVMLLGFLGLLYSTLFNSTCNKKLQGVLVGEYCGSPV